MGKIKTYGAFLLGLAVVGFPAAYVTYLSSPAPTEMIRTAAKDPCVHDYLKGHNEFEPITRLAISDAVQACLGSVQRLEQLKAIEDETSDS